MKVSILIPTYNQEKYIEQCINSALSQTYNNLEIILSDDCSKDGTFSVCKKFDKYENIRVYKNNKNIGRVKNYQKLLYDYCSGEWAINVDGDDYLIDKDFIFDAVKLIKDGDVIISAGRLIEKKGKIIGRNKKCLGGRYKGDYVFEYWRNPFEINHISMLYNTQKAKEVEFYKDDIISSDRVSIWKALSMGNVLFLPKFVAVWRCLGDSESKQIDLGLMRKNSESVDIACEYWKNQNILSKAVLKGWKDRNKSIFYYDHFSIVVKKGSYLIILKYFELIRKDSLKYFTHLLLNVKVWAKLLIKITRL